MAETVQTRLMGPGYCALTGQVSHTLNPGDDCTLCSEPLTTLPDLDNPIEEWWT